MTTAVLKNRLLNSTNGEFNERNFGVSSMVEFARLFPEDLEVDTQSRPPAVRLRRPDTFAAPITERSGSTDRRMPYKRSAQICGAQWWTTGVARPTSGMR